MELKQYNLLRVALLFFIFCFFILTLVDVFIFKHSLKLYLFLASAFLATRLLFAFVAIFFPKKWKKMQQPYTVLLPVKNEDKEILNRCLEMLVKQKGIKQILIGDDGSTIPVSQIVRKDILPLIEIVRSEGVGKKEMQIMLIQKAKYPLAVQMDSDIILSTDNDLNNLVSYLRIDNRIGIINAKIKVIAKGRLLEKIQEFQYLCANDIGRSGMGRFGINPCATGELLAFRLDVFRKYLDEYRNTKHINQLMKFGEDRFMTNILLRAGYRSIVAEDVICYTFPKKDFKTLYKQQKRWKLSGVRESIRCIKEVNNTYLKVWSLLNFVLPMIFYILFINLLIYDLVFFDFESILLLFSSLIVIALISEIPVLIRYPRMIWLVAPFTMYNLFVITPLWFYSIFNQTEVTWGTR